MNNIAVLGSSWGDEGKGKIIHDWSDKYDWVIKYSGGSNCGAMVYRNGKPYVHHQIPVVDYTRSNAKSFIAAGTVVNLSKLLNEILEMQKDFPGIGKNIIVDPDAFVVLPEHIEQDKVEGQAQGTTFQGIKQAYTAKVNRIGKRVYNFINDNAEIITALKNEGVSFIPALALRETFEKSNLLFEGNQGVMLSLDCGIYPFITSSDCTVSGIYSAGFNWVKLNEVYGAAKGGYITRSGGCKLPTEMPDDEQKIIVEKANEKGNTTGRARGIGYFDCAALRYACLKGGITKLILTKLDIMNGQDSIKVCYSYGKDVFSPNDFKNVQPKYIDIPGWNDASNLDEIHPFISFVEKYVGYKVKYVSCGLKREHLKNIERQF